MARKLALIIGNSQYEDAGLSRLAAPDVDVRTLAEILQSPGIGAFDEVMPLLNEGLASVRKAIARFFDAKHRDDLLLLYFSGHGVRDEQGHLYLAVRDTERAVLAGTAIEASYVTTRMDRSASKRLVLVLDCCHSGAFGLGAKSAQGATVGTASAFEGTGRGRVVLTATDSTQFAWEGDQVIGDVENSLFTHYLIEGLRTGAADRDEDGQITIDELYDYVYDHVLNDTPKQTPGKWAFGQQGEIVIAQNPGVTVARLPPELDEALRSTLPSVRFQVLTELYSIARGRHEGRARAAREAMQRLAADDSRKVASGAGLYLQALDRNETLTEEEWVQRSREREDELSGRKTIAAQVESFVAAATTSLERGALDDVRELLGRAIRLDPKDVATLRLQERLDDALAERARLEDAERRIREIRKSIAGLIARANASAAHNDAIALLDEALGLDPEDAEVRQLLETRHRQAHEVEALERARREKEAEAAALVQAELERRARLEGQLAEAARHLARENLTKAIVITESVLRADPDNAAARDLLARAQGAIEAKRLADEQAAQTREKRRRLEDMIATAEAAGTPDSAIEILETALLEDPGNARAQRLLARRRLDVEEARDARARASLRDPGRCGSRTGRDRHSTAGRERVLGRANRCRQDVAMVTRRRAEIADLQACFRIADCRGADVGYARANEDARQRGVDPDRASRQRTAQRTDGRAASSSGRLDTTTAQPRTVGAGDQRHPRSPMPSPGLPIRTRRRRAILSATGATDRRRAGPASRRKRRPIRRQQQRLLLQLHRQALRHQLLPSRQASPPPATNRRPKSRCRFGVILPRNQPARRAHRQLLRVRKSPPRRILLAPSPTRRRSGSRSRPTSARSPPAIAKP